MASLSASGGAGYISWTISGLGNAFKTEFYKSAGICTGVVSDGASYVSGVIGSVTASSSGTSKSVSGQSACSAGTYTIYAFAQAANGKYYPAGSASVTVTSSSGGGTTASFSWDNPKVQGGAWNTTASEWNKLTAFIKAKKPSYSFTTVYKGTQFTASIYNEVASALGLATVSSGATCTAQMMNNLVTKANSL